MLISILTLISQLQCQVEAATFKLPEGRAEAVQCLFMRWRDGGAGMMRGRPHSSSTPTRRRLIRSATPPIPLECQRRNSTSSDGSAKDGTG